jgi:hypothetical protein
MPHAENAAALSTFHVPESSDEGRALVSEVLAEIGGPIPVEPKELAALIGLRLVGHASGDDVAELVEALGDPSEGDFAGNALYDASAPEPAQARAIALACARWLAADRGFDPSDEALVEYLACALCGLPRASLRPTRP